MKSLNSLPNACLSPFIHAAFRPDGKVRPCCIYSEDIPLNTGELGDVNFHSVKDIYNSTYMKNLRAAFLRGEKPAGCRQCWDEEKKGVHSKRMKFNEIYKDKFQSLLQNNSFMPQDIQAVINTTCNYKCRTCNGHNSSKWIGEAKARGLFSSDMEAARENLSDDQAPFWTQMDNWLEGIEHLQLLGGEPLLTPRTWKILERAVEIDCAKNMAVTFVTNGSISLLKYKKLLSEFKDILICFSVDGIDERFNYLRHPGSWIEVEKNIIESKHVVKGSNKISFSHTLSNLNISYLPDFFSKITNITETMGIERAIFFNLVFHPQHFQIYNLQEEKKPEISQILKNYKYWDEYQDQIDGFINYLSQSSSQDLLETAKSDILAGDKYRSESFQGSLPLSYEAIF